MEHTKLIGSIKVYLWILLSLCSALVWPTLAQTSPPPLPVAGDLTDQQGNPLNQTVTLTFSITESETSDQVLWTEQHDNVTVKQGRFAVLLGARRDLMKNDGSPIDFTQKKYIKVSIKRDGKDSYALTPPLIYMPTLGSWQSVHADKAKYADKAELADKAKQADNAGKLEGHGWDEIININNYPLVIETGVVNHKQLINGRVEFSQIFKNNPIVMIGINSLDIKGNFNATVHVQVVKVDNQGFDYSFRGGAIYAASANWIAIGR